MSKHVNRWSLAALVAAVFSLSAVAHETETSHAAPGTATSTARVAGSNPNCWTEFVPTNHPRGARDLLPEGVGAATGGAAGHVWKKRAQSRSGDGYYVEHCRVVN